MKCEKIAQNRAHHDHLPFCTDRGCTLHGRARQHYPQFYPPGLYLMTDAPIQKGALVIFCPTDTPIFRQARERGYVGAGFCPGGYGYMIKKILAAEHDHVAFSAEGITVNGHLLPNSAPMVADLEGRPLTSIPRQSTTLDAQSVLLMSDYSQKSFDARYFGLTNRTAIISTVQPLWLW